MAGCRMNDQARRLVDNEHVVVFEQHRHRRVSFKRTWSWLCELFVGKFNDMPSTHTRALDRRLTVDRDEPLIQQLLCSCTRTDPLDSGKEFIDPLPRKIF